MARLLPDWLIQVLVAALLLLVAVPSLARLPSLWARLPGREVNVTTADALVTLRPGTRLLVEGVVEPAPRSSGEVVAACRDDTMTAASFGDLLALDCGGRVLSRLSAWGPAKLERRGFLVRVGGRTVSVTNTTYRLRFAPGRAPDRRLEFADDASREFLVRRGAVVTVEGVLASNGAAPVLRAAELYEGAAPAFRRDWEAARREGALRALVMTCAVLVVVGLLAAYAAGYLPWLRPRL